ncbi:radical SAM protein [Selenihalanaerobacter shriftii]|uniref:Elp3/MiaA/NifB-like radical SAM core domain-containing protein n=1 Tax=Selenihalanaerobacter shriftii TaxID=142842 RepID=A0A1T4JJQ9_9FIRM|nr:radical SAM protein [Selenihalanaerobacter shriftii]SJZ30386.1 hypothetical protein SAMN02745118_00055 [Selenihalanaerobacter shriftii]
MEVREISSSLQNKLKEAWEVRCRNFPSFIKFEYPSKTKPISLTGNECSLDCAHCGGHYLKHMDSLEEFQVQSQEDVKSCLISGGCDPNGKVNLTKNLDELKEIADNKRTNMHVGLVEEEEIAEISQLADVVSFDFIADQETIQEVYGLDRSVEDYINTYQKLKKEVKVLPHICIGLKGGELAGEYEALEVLEELGADGLVFIVFIPTKDTEYADCTPPPLEEVIELLTMARIKFPEIPIHLGCMRPKGRYRAELDYYAVEAGVNKLVVPTSFGVKKAEELGLTIEKGEECCVL